MGEVTERMIRMLKESGVEYEIIEHEPVYTAEQAAAERGVTPADGVKSLLFKGSHGFILVLQRGDLRVETKLIKQLEKTKDLTLASPEDVEQVVGVKIGAVPPFGLSTHVKTYMSKAIFEKEKIFTQLGAHTLTVKLRSRDLERIVKPAVMF